MNKRQKEATTSFEEQVSRIRMPYRNENEVFGIATQLLGSDQIKIMCEDNIERTCRIPGKMRKKVWIREGDLVIVKIWDFQPIKGDVVWRYLKPQAEHLQRKGALKNLQI